MAPRSYIQSSLFISFLLLWFVLLLQLVFSTQFQLQIWRVRDITIDAWHQYIESKSLHKQSNFFFIILFFPFSFSGKLVLFSQKNEISRWWKSNIRNLISESIYGNLNTELHWFYEDQLFTKISLSMKRHNVLCKWGTRPSRQFIPIPPKFSK